MVGKTLDYGMKIIVKAKPLSNLFFVKSDKERYLSCVLKMLEGHCDEGVKPIIAGFYEDNRVEIVFSGGSEEYFKKLIQRTHISYSSYGRNKNMIVKFDKTEFVVLETSNAIAAAIKKIEGLSDYLCNVFDEELIVVLNFKNRREKTAEHILSIDSVREYITMLNDAELKEYIIFLKERYGLSYRKISEIMNFSRSKIFKIMNN